MNCLSKTGSVKGEDQGDNISHIDPMPQKSLEDNKHKDQWRKRKKSAEDVQNKSTNELNSNQCTAGYTD